MELGRSIFEGVSKRRERTYPVPVCWARAYLHDRVIAVFYYGSLSRPSVDPPRIGFMSTVPADAGQRLSEDVRFAQDAHVDLPSKSAFTSASIGPIYSALLSC